MSIALKVGGFTPWTSTDFPGRLAAVVFVQGCPWRCRYCHNPHLQARPSAANSPRWDDIEAFLRRRRGLLDAVVFSGGEPLRDPALPAAMRAVRTLGFAVGLHTAGIYPRRLAQVLPLIDWVGLDIKAQFSAYSAITGVAGSGERARESLQVLLRAGVDYEVRTTVHSALLSQQRLLALAEQLAAMGVERYVLQEFRAQGCDDPTLNATHEHCGAALQQVLARRVAALSVRAN